VIIVDAPALQFPHSSSHGLRCVSFGQAGDQPYRLDAYADHLADEPDDVFLVVGPVGIGADAAALVLGHLVLVDDPIQGAAVT
jgi:hypothetical protein